MGYTFKRALEDFTAEALAEGMLSVLEKDNVFVKEKKITKKNEIYGADPFSRYFTEIQIEESYGELLKTRCTCDQYKTQYFSCIHITELIMSYFIKKEGMDVIRESEIFEILRKKTGIDDPFIPGILRKTDERILKLLKADMMPIGTPELKDNKQPSFLKVRCCILERNKGLQVELRVGTNRYYVVKDIYNFLEAWDKKQQLELGKKLKFIPDEQLLDERSKKIIKFMKEEYWSQKAVCDEDFNYRHDKRSISIYGVRIDEFMQNIASDGVFHISDEKKEIRYLEEEHKPHLYVKKTQFGATIKMDDYSVFCESCDYQYIKNEDYIYRLKKTDSKTQTILDICNYRNELYISDRDLPQAARSMFGILEAAAKVTYTNINPDDYMMENPKLAIYLDLVQENMISCDPVVIYGHGKYHVYSTRYDQRRNFQYERELLGQLQPEFNAFDEKNKLLILSLDESGIFNFLKYVIPRLKKIGDIYISQEMEKLKVRPSGGFQVGISVMGGLLEMSMVSNQFNKEELADMFSSYDRKKKYHRLKNGSFVTFSDEEDRMISVFSEMMEYADEKNPESIRMPLFRAAYFDELLENKESVKLKKDDAYKKLVENIKNYDKAKSHMPQTLEKVLRKYQKEGVSWLTMLKDNGFGGILADDMGLGKTLQVLAFLLLQKESGKNKEKLRTLIVAPASLVYNWKSEIQRFAPSLTLCVISGSANERKTLIKEKAQGADLWITSYDLLKRDINEYKDVEFANQIIDEAQYIKNHTTQISKAVRLVKSSFRIALTGTPLENRLSELWSIFNYLMPGYLYGYTRFRKEIEVPIISDKNEEAMEKLRKMIQPFVLRRMKPEVLKELPPKQEEIIEVSLSGEQQKLYQAHAQRLKMFLEEQDDEEFSQNKLQVLAELTKLRQICCGPELLFEHYEAENAKLEACMELVTQAVEGKHKILIFSQFTTMLDIIEKELDKKNISHYRIDGSTKKELRMELVEQFQNEKNDVPVFCISLKAGGTGLNLTEADIVIHYDPWWNKSVQNQATDRAHRIGQTKPINVYQLIADETIEKKICELQKVKTELADEILSAEGIKSIAFDKEEILNILGV